MEMIIYHHEVENESIARLVDLLLDSELEFMASELLYYGFSDRLELEKAVERAIGVCHTAHIPVRPNFKSVYLVNEGTVESDWRLSSLARKLVIINAGVSNPLMARIQIELLKSNRNYVKI